VGTGALRLQSTRRARLFGRDKKGDKNGLPTTTENPWRNSATRGPTDWQLAGKSSRRCAETPRVKTIGLEVPAGPATGAGPSTSPFRVDGGGRLSRGGEKRSYSSHRAPDPAPESRFTAKRLDGSCERLPPTYLTDELRPGATRSSCGRPIGGLLRSGSIPRVGTARARRARDATEEESGIVAADGDDSGPRRSSTANRRRKKNAACSLRTASQDDLNLSRTSSNLSGNGALHGSRTR